MNNLITTKKNGSLANTKKDSNFQNFSSFLDDFFISDFPALQSTSFGSKTTTPKVNIKEDDVSFTLELSAPGMNKKDFSIDLDDAILTISSEVKVENDNSLNNYTRREFGYSSFKRSFTLPDTINESNIKASYQDGILVINLPKKEEAKKKPARTINIS